MRFLLPALGAVVLIAICAIFGLTVRAFVAISNLWSTDDET